jgi:hypothetical protein
MTAPTKVHYILSVHGIGQARRGEQALQLAQGLLLNHRAGTNDTLLSSELTLGKVLGNDNGAKDSALFVPLELGPDQPKLIIVDGCWSDVTEERRQDTASSLATWSEALRLRLARRTKLRRMSRLLRDARRILLPIEKGMRWQFPDLARTIFDDFLSDVQVYAEYAPARQAAITRLSGYLEDIVTQHEAAYGNDAPDYDISIVAHSLGTVASLDVLAHAALMQDTEPAAWYSRIKHFVTLGSPIDKFLVLWSENYRAYEKLPALLKESTDTSREPIQFWNYCDELDPVGHHIDLLRSLPWAETLFTFSDDQVYTRYCLPGKAHVDYWHDEALMQRIQHIVTHKNQDREPTTIPDFKLGSYIVTLILTYVIPPISLTLVIWALASTVSFCDLLAANWRADGFWQGITSLIATLVVLAGGSLGLRMLFMWRQMNVHLARSTGQKKSTKRSLIGHAVIWGCFRLSPAFWLGMTIWSVLTEAAYPTFFGAMTVMSLIVWGLFEYSRQRARVAVRELITNRSEMRSAAITGSIPSPT